VQCVNPFSESAKLPAGSVLGRFHSIQEKDIGPSLGDATEGPRLRPSKGRGNVSPQVKELYETACDGCASNEERQAMAKLLPKLQRRVQQWSLTRAVRHEIPLAAGTVPNWPPTWRLWPEKEVSRQVRDLLDRGLIEPAHSAWSSPVVLVYPLPRIDESLDALAGSKYFNTIDLLSGYWQVLLSPDAQEKAAFITQDGLWK